MAEYSSNIELAQEISARIGTEPIPFESVSGLCYQIYEELGGEPEDFDDVYSILLEILPLASGGGGGRLEAGTGITIEEKIISANAEATTTEDISLSNGAPINALGIWSNDIIPSGTSIQEILIKLLLREIFPSTATKPNFSVSDSALGTKEVNSTVTVTEPTTTKENGKYNASFTNPAQPSVSGVVWSNETVSTETTGFTGSGSERTVVLGTNKIKYTFSKDYSAPSNMPITNLGHKTQSTSKISTDNSDISAIWAASSITKTAEVTATGVYRCFSNISGGTLTTNANTKCSLTAGNEITLTDVPSEVVADKHFKFAFPTGRTVTFKVKDLAGNFVNFAGSYTTETVQNYYGGFDYIVLTTSGDKVGVNTYKMVFNKNLNS